MLPGWEKKKKIDVLKVPQGTRGRKKRHSVPPQGPSGRTPAKSEEEATTALYLQERKRISSSNGGGTSTDLLKKKKKK